MAAEQQVTIIILGKDSASKVIRALGGEAEKAGTQIEKGLSKSLQKAGKEMTAVGKKLSVGLTAPLGAFAAVALNTAIKAERLTKTLDGLAGGSENAAKYINAIKEASLGTIPKVEALAIANRSLSFGIVKNAEEMAKLTRIAVTLGRAQGLDAATAVRDFSTALSRNSPLILDNLGITLKLTESYAIFADKIGKSVSALTAEEKAMAFREAALIKGMEKVEQMGGLQDDMAASGERLKAQMSDLSIVIGTALIPAMQTGLDIVGPLVKAFSEADPAIQKVVIGMAAMAAGAGPAMTMLGPLIGGIGKLAKSAEKSGGMMNALKLTMGGTGIAILSVTAALVAAYGAYQAYNEYQKKVETGFADMNAALDSWEGKAEQMRKKGLSAKVVMEQFADATNKATDALYKDGNALEDVGAAIIRATIGARVYTDIQSQAMDLIRSMAGDYKDVIYLVNEYNKAQEDSKARIQDWTEVAKEAQYQADWTSRPEAKIKNYAKVVSESTFVMTDAMNDFATSGEEAAAAYQKLFGIVLDGLSQGENRINRVNKVSQVRGDILRKEKEHVEMLARTEKAMAQSAREYEQVDLWNKMVDGIVEADKQARNLEATQMRMARADIERAEAGAWGPDLKPELDARTAAEEEYAAHHAELSEKWASATEAAEVRRRAAWVESQNELANLIGQMSEATEEQFLQAVFAGITPEMAGGAWNLGQIGESLGLLSSDAAEKGLAAKLAIDAVASGALVPENLPETLSGIFGAIDGLDTAHAGDVRDIVGEMIDKFSSADGIEPTAIAMERYNNTLARLGEEVGAPATREMDAFGTAAGGAAEPVLTLSGNAGDLYDNLSKLNKTWNFDVVTTFKTNGTPPPGYYPPKPKDDDIPHYQSGGIVPGPTGAPIMAIVHGGERIIPAGGGTVTNSNMTFGGDTMNVYNPLAAAILSNQQRQRRFDRMNARM